jgi:transcriptional regulator with XRE-family HTH domain
VRDTRRMGSELLELVRARRLELGLSYQSLAAACVDPTSGVKASAAWLHRLETSAPVIPPSVDVLGAMAVGLQLPRAQLQEAAAAQFFDLHIPWEMSGEAAAILADLAVLPEGQQQAVVNLLRVLAEGESGQPSM